MEMEHLMHQNVDQIRRDDKENSAYVQNISSFTDFLGEPFRALHPWIIVPLNCGIGHLSGELTGLASGKGIKWTLNRTPGSIPPRLTHLFLQLRFMNTVVWPPPHPFEMGAGCRVF